MTRYTPAEKKEQREEDNHSDDDDVTWECPYCSNTGTVISPLGFHKPCPLCQDPRINTNGS